MKLIKLSLVIIFSACLFFACTVNNSSENKPNADAKTSAPDSKTASSGVNLTGTNGSFTYTVNGLNVKMTYQEFNVIHMTFTGTLNSSSNILIGNLNSNQPGSTGPSWYLTKP